MIVFILIGSILAGRVLPNICLLGCYFSRFVSKETTLGQEIACSRAKVTTHDSTNKMKAAVAFIWNVSFKLEERVRWSFSIFYCVNLRLWMRI